MDIGLRGTLIDSICKIHNNDTGIIPDGRTTAVTTIRASVYAKSNIFVAVGLAYRAFFCIMYRVPLGITRIG